MLAVASNLFGKSSSLSAYALHSASPSPASSSTYLPSTATASTSTASSSKSITVGLWRVLGATHKTTGKEVSVWIFEKKILDGVKGDSGGRNAAQAKEWVLDQVKKEVRGNHTVYFYGSG